MFRRIAAALFAVLALGAVFAAPAAAVKDDCPPGIGLPGKDPIIPIYC